MTIIEALNRLPSDKWQMQDLQKCFLEGRTTKNGASIKFQTTQEIVLGMNHAAMAGGKPDKIGIVIWVDSAAWEKATTPACIPECGEKQCAECPLTPADQP